MGACTCTKCHTARCYSYLRHTGLGTLTMVGGGGGGGTSIYYSQEWIISKSFNVRKHQRFLLRLNGYN